MLSESVGLLYDQTAKSILGTLISAAVLVLVESSVIEDRVLFGWLGAIVFISVLRFVLLIGYRRSQSSEAHPLYWRNLFIAGALTAALVWGSTSLLLFAPASIAHQTFLAFILAGVSAGAAPVLAPSLITVLPFLGLALLPLAGQFLLQDSEIQIAMGGMLIVLFLFLLFVVRWTHETMHTALALRHANLDLVEYLDLARDRAERANQHLQLEIQERREIERQLNKAKEEAEQASRSKGDFLATISHEIRTPMNGVMGTLELVADMPLGDEQRGLVTTAYNSAESLIRIISDVLDFSKIEVGRLELEDIDFDLLRLVAEVTGLLGKRAQEKGLTITHKISDGTPANLRGDPTRLRQILNNLVGNAVKFTQRGKIEVRVDVARNMPTNVLLRFEVQDTGIGIDPLTQANLFQPFTQADSSMARKYGGTGLGLSISKQLVELMGGQIGLQSIQGKGSIFWFTLYLSKPTTSARQQRTDLRNTLLLVMTADQELRAAFQADLSSRGANIELTATPQETLQKLESSARIGRSWSYDAVIMDAASEPARLTSLISRIRSDKHLTGTALVVIGPEPGELEVLGLAADVCLPTPLKTQALFDALTGLIDRSEFSDISSTIPTAAASRVEPIMLAPSLKRPKADAAPDSIATMETGATTVVADKPGLPPLRGQVLMAEDNPVNQKVGKTMMERLGIMIDLANDGSQAVDMTRNKTYDLVLMDCQMPGMDGYEATRVMRRFEQENRRHPTPIIAVTANAMEGDRERCLEAGMDDYLSKPFKQETLRDMLVKWLPDDAMGDSADAGEKTPVEQNQTVVAPEISTQPEATGHILVADDDDVNQRLARAMLVRLGYRVDLASNGREAIAAMDADSYDAVLMDCEMPEMGGIEATKQIRRIEQERNAPRTPILALTGHTDKSDRERCLQSGMDAVLTKPVKRDTLAESLLQHLSRHQTTKEIAAMSEIQPTIGNGPALDEATVSELKDVMGDEFGALVRAFLDDAPTRIYAMRDGIKARDTEAIRIAAHTLKSSAANLGAMALSKQASEMEALARNGKLSGVVELLKKMAEEFKRAGRELKSL